MRRNATNERIKHRFLAYLRGPLQLDEQSIDAAAGALDRFDESNRWRDFKTFRPEQADAFQRVLARERSARTSEPLSKSTVVSTLRELKRFFFWLADQPGYRRLQHDWAEHFNPPRKALEVARARRPPRAPTLMQVREMIAAQPANTPLEKRDRAVIALTAITASRVDATASLRLKHLDLDAGVLHLDGREVRTKFGKTFDVTLCPIGGEAEAILDEWVEYLKSEFGFGPNDPLFPATRTGFDRDGRPAAPTLSRDFWATADPIRAIFKKAFANAGMANFNPHSFRHTLTQHVMSGRRSAEELKAFSQNLGHTDMLVTLTSYGEVPFHRQHELIRASGDREEETERLIELGRAVLAATKAKQDS
jgi:integrase